MIEDNYELYLHDNNYCVLLASNMTIDNAVLFISAWFQKYYNEEQASIEIKRQSMTVKESE